MKNHESALLVVLSYVIGFTTAFIMFVLANDTKNQIIDPAFESDLGMTQDRPASKLELMQTGDGLFVKLNGQERIISAFTSESKADVGFYTAIVSATISPDERYVHYCAEMEDGADTCRHFVYSAAEDATYMLKDAGEQLETPDAMAVEWSWSVDSTLSDGERVAGPASRWVID